MGKAQDIKSTFRMVMGLMAIFVPGVSGSASLLLSLEQVTENVYAVVGPLGQRSPENLGNNATFGFVITDDGVVLIDSGATRKGAQALHEIVRGVTDKPITVVINTGSQDHRWLGNAYFIEQGARVIASRRAVEHQKTQARNAIAALVGYVGETTFGNTQAAYADEVFDAELKLTLGGERFEIHHVGPAHTPGDAFVWLPDQRVMFSGGIVCVARIPRISSASTTRGWVSAFEAIATFDPEHIVPGHGPVATLARARQDTYDYLVALRRAVGDFIEAGNDIADVGMLDFSRFSHLANYDILQRRNAQHAFLELEWE